MKTQHSYAFIFAIFFAIFQINAQTITIFPDDYKQVFEGGGATAGLYLGHYNSMSRQNQLLASKMLYEDLNLNYIRFFPQPRNTGERFDQFANFVKNARLYNPSVKVMINLNRLPGELSVKVGHNYIPNLEVPNVMERAVDYYMNVFGMLKDRGIDVDYFEPVNETKLLEGTLQLFTKAVPILKARLNNPRQNPKRIKVPLITGPSTWSAASVVGWVNRFKNADNGIGWNNLDVVSTHGYQKGTEENYKRGAEAAGNKPFINNEQTAKLQRDEGAPVDVLAEQFMNQEPPRHVNDVSIAMRMSDLINGGGNAFFHFLTNNPKNNNAALLFTKYGGVPKKGPSYDGFRQVSSLQPKNSRRVGNRSTNTQNLKVVTMRHPSQPDLVYMHVTNSFPQPQDLTVDLKDENGRNYQIKRVRAIISDGEKDYETVLNRNFSTEVFSYSITGHSVNSFVFTVEEAVSNTCSVVPFSKINAEDWVRTEDIIAQIGDNVRFGPQSEEFGPRGGSWSWTGPNNYTASVREIALGDIRQNQAGTYTVTNTDQNDCTTILQYSLKIDSPITRGGIFEVQPQNNQRLRLDVQRNGTQNGTLVIAYTAHGRPNQRWRFVHIRNNIYEIEPQHALGKRLGVVASTTISDGAPITIHDDLNQRNQRWRLLPSENGLYEFESLATPGMRLDLEGSNPGAKVMNNTGDAKASQRYRLIPLEAKKETTSIENGFEVYPNPVKNVLTIQANPEVKSYTIKVVDLSGRQLFEKSVSANQKTSDKLELSTESWSPGLYTITIMNESNKSVTKILKN